MLRSFDLENASEKLLIDNPSLQSKWISLVFSVNLGNKRRKKSGAAVFSVTMLTSSCHVSVQERQWI